MTEQAVMTSSLYIGQSQVECFRAILKWAKIERYDSDLDIGDCPIEELELEADKALDYLQQTSEDYLYDLDVNDGMFFFTRYAFGG